jgi:hypothetical protein
MADPVPGPVRDGPRVRLPHRDYLLYRGPAEAVTALADKAQTPNLWWPADRAWCVATEIDLRCTYVGGPAGLIAALLADDAIEALPARPDDLVSLVLEDWVAAWVEDLTSTLLAEGQATVVTSRGTVRAWRQRQAGDGPEWLRIEVDGDDGSQSSSEGRLWAADPAALRRDIRFQVTFAIVGLAPDD